MARARRDADAERRAAEATRHELNERLETLRDAAHDDALGALRRARDELDRLRATLKRPGSGADVASAKERLGALAEAIAEHAPRTPPPQGEAPPPQALAPGTRVAVPRLGGRGQEHREQQESEAREAVRDDSEGDHVGESAGTFAPEHDFDGLDENREIKQQAAILYVVEIVLKLLERVLLG